MACCCEQPSASCASNSSIESVQQEPTIAGSVVEEEQLQAQDVEKKCMSLLRRFPEKVWGPRWLTEHLKTINRGYKVNQCNFAEIEDKGLVATLFKVHLTWTIADDGASIQANVRLPQTVALKTVIFEDHLLLQDGTVNEKLIIIDILRKGHNAECAFYSLWEDGTRAPTPLATCYHADTFNDDTSTQGCLLFEDLSMTAAVRPQVDSFDFKTTLNVIECIASLHAYSLRDRRWLNYPQLSRNYAEYGDQFGDAIVQNLEANKATLLRLYPEHFDPVAHRITDLYQSVDGLEWMYTLHERLGVPVVLCHGDMWSNNIMFALDAQRQITSRVAAVIDWQTVHAGCMAEDIVRLLTTSVSARTRRDSLEVILRHYYRCLSERLAAPPLAHAQSPPFDMATLRLAYNQLFIVGVSEAIGPLTAWLAIEASDEQKTVATWLFGDGIKRDRRRLDLIHRCKALLEDCPLGAS